MTEYPRKPWKVFFAGGILLAIALLVHYAIWDKLTFLQQLLLSVAYFAVAFAADYIARLADRVKYLEKQLDSASVVNLVNRLAQAILRPPDKEEIPEADDIRSALELVDHYIGHRLFQHIPGLRRVLSVTISLSLDMLREKAGIVGEELTGLEDQLSPSLFSPVVLMVIEEWATHTVIIDYKGNRQVLYKSAASSHSHYAPAKVIWKHIIHRGRTSWDDGTLEVVLHEGYIKCWAIDGRFGRRIPPERVATAEYVFVSIPMEEGLLAQYEDTVARNQSLSWLRHYEHEEADRSFSWTLHVNDVVSYVQGRG